MRYTADDWNIIETEHGGDRPSQTYLKEANKAELVAILGALKMLAAAGIPPDREHGTPNLQRWKKYKPKGRKTKYQIYVLKTTPHRWRLYVYVPNRANKQIEVLHAVSKKEDKRDPADLKRCKYLLDRIAEDTATCRAVDLDLPS